MSFLVLPDLVVQDPNETNTNTKLLVMSFLVLPDLAVQDPNRAPMKQTQMTRLWSSCSSYLAEQDPDRASDKPVLTAR
jgi:hypothetical protein